jgi:tRNA threonylcarbamoyladenosine biosynthesis protein TsaE
MRKKRIEIITHSPEETKALGQKIGRQLEPGAVIALTGELGSGKTVFVQGLAAGLDVPADYYITSPTFTFVNEYPGRHPFYHVDLFRIENRDDLDEIGLLEMLHGEGITAIEWADRLQEDLSAAYLDIHLEIIDDETRKFFIDTYGLEAINLI